MSGLTLLVPLGLLGLIGIPLIILLYMRTTIPAGRRIPSTRFWANAPTPPSDSRRFRPPPLTLLFLIHLLVAGLLTLAIARPVSADLFSQFGTRTEPKHLILIVDGSTSMAAIADTVRAPKATRYLLAQREVANKLNALQNGDIVTLLLLGTQVQTFQASNTAAIQDLSHRFADLPQPGGRADLNAALRLCQDLLLPGLKDEIVLITDGALQVDPTLAARIAAPITLDQITNTGTTDNLALTEISARGATDEPGRQDLFVRLVNFADTPATTTVTISADQREISTIDISLEPGASRTITQRLPVGTIRAAASLGTSDAQPLDDQASITLAGDGAGGLRIALVSDAPTAIQRGLNALPGAIVTVYTLNQFLATTPLPQLDLVVFEGAVPDNVAGLPKLPMLVINPGASFAPVLTTMATPQPIRIVAQSPVLSGVDLAGVTFGQTPAYQLASTDIEIVGAADGPLLYQSTSANGQPELVLPFDIAQSNISQRVAFPILVSNLVSTLVARSIPAALAVGDPLVATLRSATDSVTIIDPAMGSHDFPLAQLAPVGTTHQLTFTNTGKPGLYQLQEMDATGTLLTTSYISVNAGQMQESAIKPNPLLKQGLISGDATSATTGAAEATDLWPLILMAVLGLLALDWLLTIRQLRRSQPIGATS
ncbi:MAG TPA: VWA domain-containing protein [Thermomicrobiales bacterium]|nr:VWA domain-containing protein [Thermomicrobiales bacterium]